MFIQTEETPNPATLKFIPGTQLLTSGTANYKSQENASNSPLAKRLFQIEGVSGVFLSTDFLSVTKLNGFSWEFLKPHILAEIMDHLTAGLPVMVEEKEDTSKSDAKSKKHSEEDQEIVDQITELIDTRVRPAVAMDGGDIIFHSYEDGVVFLEMHGACAGCPSSTATLKAGIENMLCYYIPEIQEVRAINDEINEEV